MTNLIILSITAIFSLIAATCYCLCISIIKKAPPPIGRMTYVAVFAGYVFVVLAATLIFRSRVNYNFELNIFASYLRAARAPAHLAIIEIRNIILNIAMFIPLGIMLPMAAKPLTKPHISMPIAIASTLAIEVTQFITRRGVFATEDIMHNTLGAAIGLAIFKISKILIKIYKNY